MGGCLVVANQTLGGAALRRALNRRIAAGVTEFFVVVPMVEPAHETAWIPADPAFGVVLADDIENAVERARARSQRRLDRMLERIRSCGGVAAGEIGDSDPVLAARDALTHHPELDDVLLSTLPAGLSRWIRMDVPSRLDRAVDLPVEVVEASEDDADDLDDVDDARRSDNGDHGDGAGDGARPH